MNTPFPSGSSATTDFSMNDAPSLQPSNKKRSSSAGSLLHNPRKFLAAVMGVTLMSVLGIGLVVGMQSMNQSTEDRSSASYGLNNMQIYFEPDNKTINTAGETITIPVKLVAGHNIGAVTFGVAFDPNMVNGGQVTFVPNPQYSVEPASGQVIDVPNTPSTQEKIFMAYAKSAQSTGVPGGSIGSLSIVTNPNFTGNSIVKFLYPCNSNCNTMSQGFNTATFPGLGQVVISQDPYAGMLFQVQPANNLRVSRGTGGGGPTATPTTTTLPNPDPAIQFTGTTSLGRLFYCPADACTTVAGQQVPQWVAVTLNPGQTQVTVPSTAKKLMYDTNTTQVPGGWTRNTRADYPDGTALVRSGVSQVETPVLTAAQWPVKLGANFNIVAGGLQYQCTIRPFGGSNPSQREFSYMRVGQPQNQVVIGPCTNNTNIVVNKQGGTAPTATPTPTNTPVPGAPTATPTPTPGTTALQCRSTSPRLDAPVLVAPSVVSVDNGARFVLKWKNVLKNAPQGGRYGIYLVNDGTQSSPASGGQFYLFDVRDNNISFSTNSSGGITDSTLNVVPGTGDSMSFTWTVPTDLTKVDKLGTPVKNRSFYRFLVYAYLNDGTSSCANQATIGRWVRP